LTGANFSAAVLDAIGAPDDCRPRGTMVAVPQDCQDARISSTVATKAARAAYYVCQRMMRYVLLLIGMFGAAIVYSIGGYAAYTLLLYLFCALVLLIGIMVIVRGRLRDLCLVTSSILLCFIFVEVYHVFGSRAWPEQQEKVSFVPDPSLGWSPSAPGTFHSKKVDRKSDRVIFDVANTIDQHLQRKTISNEGGPTVAFFGDSFTFGEGLQDSETLPQTFSDLENQRLRILNFGIPGYGPQQFLRAMETGIFRTRLRNSRLFVFLTAPWHAERTSCLNPSMLRSPRYIMKDGQVTYTGACAYGPLRILWEIVGHSAAYRALLSPTFTKLNPTDIDLYIAIVARAIELARKEYGVPTLILYLPFAPEYLSQTGYTDADIMQKLREAGAYVVDAAINPAEHPGVDLFIPGDGHPTGAANRLWAKMIKDWVDKNAVPVDILF
jgi:uncharacterized membrane protein YhaH (DUF805 family)